MDTIYSIVNNDYSIYSRVEILTNQVAKRVRKNLPVTEEHLAKCVSMKRIISQAVSIGKKWGWNYSKEERKDAAIAVAQNIIESAEYLAKND